MFSNDKFGRTVYCQIERELGILGDFRGDVDFGIWSGYNIIKILRPL